MNQQILMSALKTLPDGLNQAIHNIALAVQSPLPLITSSVLCSLSSAVQGHIDVETIYGAIQPISLFSLVVADSGERKSSTDRLVSKPLHQMEMEAQGAVRSLKADTQVEEIIWAAEVRRLEGQLRRTTQLTPEEIAEIAAALRNLFERKPSAINTTRTMLNDVTPAALFQHLAGEGKAVTLASSDAGNLFSRTSMDFISNVNQIWDGEDVIIARVSGNQEITNGRLTLSLMLQPDVLKRVSDRKGDLLRLSGYLARMLVTMPCSTQGFRLNTTTCQENRYLSQFHDRLTRLARESMHHQVNHQRVTLRFKPEALTVMEQFYKQVEEQLKDTASLASIRDAGSKIVNNATRIAALIHAYQHGVSTVEIDANSAVAACGLSCFYLAEFATLFGEKTLQQRAEENATLLYHWLKKNKRDVYGCITTLSTMMQFGPNRIRKRAELDLAIQVLMHRQVLTLYLHAKPAYVMWAEAFNPQFATALLA